MKKQILLLILLFSSIISIAQTDSLLRWNIQSKRIAPNVYEITAATTIPKGWYLFGINTSVEGLDPAKFTFDYANAKLQGSVKFNKPAGIINDTVFKKVNVFEGAIEIKQDIVIDSIIPSNLKGALSFYLKKNDEYIPAEYPFNVILEGGVDASADAKRIKIASIDLDHPLNNCGATKTAHSNLLSIFFLGFLGGFIALLTPCVFPMIPVTVSFFTKRSSTRKKAIANGALYGFFIFLIYVLVSVPFHLLNLKPEVLNTISTNAGLNVFFFLIFLVFSISFFGYFDITLPGNLANKTDTKSGLGTIGGIFFMALTLTIVSFSCTGPILGSLLVGSLSGGAWLLTCGLAGFGLALALPFALFAIFPDLLKSLPKSGGWLDTVKKVLAFVELALAFKFLSNADLVMHWGLLKREVFIGIWIIVSIGLIFYLFGILRLPHDYKGMKISAGRKFTAVIIILFTLYLIPGLTQTKYANLKLLSGFPPPLRYSIYGNDNVKGKGLEPNIINDYNKALELAKQQHKPLMIDFTGWACVNCRKMEENVWTQPDVYQYIKENFILVSLYVDDRAELPILQQLTYTTKDGSKKDIITTGDKWATFEAENFNQVTQPLYVLLNDEEKLINNPVGYTPDAKEYLTWLKCGKQAFDNDRK